MSFDHPLSTSSHGDGRNHYGTRRDHTKTCGNGVYDDIGVVGKIVGGKDNDSEDDGNTEEQDHEL